ncbi:CHRD domain-containing protein [Acidimangrovimonas sediminis]|uniref:CHRD domain-containing protein n=1 Tax=Acidimangrovimonas sediminis TaxID=2056283 RepID=UPI000C80113B|nr:CHRD domain-containing protein [Acidimangrovimonas sediminis]
MFSKIALASALALTAGSMASAKTMDWHAMLNAKQEVKAKKMEPKAMGEAMGTLDTDTGVLTWTVKWDHLSGPATMAHFHGPAKMGKNAGVQVNIGKISGTKSPAEGKTKIDAKQMKQLENGMWYVNIHTKENPGGEIRGQVKMGKAPM